MTRARPFLRATALPLRRTRTRETWFSRQTATCCSVATGGSINAPIPAAPCRAQTWTSISGTIQDTEFYNVSYDSQFHIAFGGVQDNGTPSQDAAGSFSYNSQTGGDGVATAMDNFTLAGSGESVRYIGTTRRIFSGADTRAPGDNDGAILPAAGLPGLTQDDSATYVPPDNPGSEDDGDDPASANDLFNNLVVNAVPPTAAQLAAGQSTRIVISGGTNTANPVGAIYESDNVGSTPKLSWAALTTSMIPGRKFRPDPALRKHRRWPTAASLAEWRIPTSYTSLRARKCSSARPRAGP